MLTSLLLLVISSSISSMATWLAWIGIGHYKEFSEDEDKHVVVRKLKSFLVVILIVLLACNVIIGYTICTEKKHHELELLEKR